MDFLATHFLSVLVIVSVFVFLVFFVLTLTTKKSRIKKYLLSVISFSLIYAVAYILELLSTNIEPKILFLKLQFVALPFITPALFLLATEFLNFKRFQVIKIKVLVFVIPIITMIAAITNDWHYLHFAIYRSIYVQGTLYLVTEPGIFEIIGTVYAGVLYFGILYFFVFRIKELSSEKSGQILFIFTGFLIPFLANAYYVIDLVHEESDPFALSLALAVSIIYFGLFKLNQPNRRIEALTNVFLQGEQASILLDFEKKTVLDINNAAKKLLNCSKRSVPPFSFDEILIKWPALQVIFEITTEQKTELSISEQISRNVYIESITNELDEVIAYKLLFDELPSAETQGISGMEPQLFGEVLKTRSSLLMGIWSVHAKKNDIKIVLANDKLAEQFSLTTREIKSKSFKDLGFPINAITDWLLILKQSEAQEQSYNVVKQFPDFKDYEASPPLNFAISYIGQSEKDKKQYAVLAWNSAESKQYEEQICLFNELLKMAKKEVRTGGWEYDVLKKKLSFSDSFYSILQLKSDTVFNKETIFELIDESSISLLKKNIRTLIRNKKAFQTDVLIFDTLHNPIWMRFFVDANFKQGKCRRLYGIFKDISAEKLKSTQLAEAQNKVEDLMNEMNVALWSLSLPEHEFLFYSPSAYDIFGIKQQEMPMSLQFFIDLIHPDDRYLIEKNKEIVLETGSHEFVIRMISYDGNIKSLQNKIKLIRDEKGVPVRLDGYIFDISPQVRIQKQLERAKDELIRVNEVKNEFLTNISHEIRTPLNSIIGFNKLLETTELTAVQQRFVKFNHVSAQLLLSIVNDILDFSRIDAGRLKLDFQKTDLWELCEEVMDVFVFQAEQKGLELLLSIHPSVPRFCRLDPVRLKQVLINLVSNAVKFTPKGVIELSLTNNQSLKVGNKVKITFSVRDTGIGIHQSEKEKLFKIFSKVDTSNTRRFGGSGLGLVIANRLVQLMAGTIQLTSQPDVGSEFFFTLSAMYEKENATNDSVRPGQALFLGLSQTEALKLNEFLSYFEINSLFGNKKEFYELLNEPNSYDYIFVDGSVLLDASKLVIQTLKEKGMNNKSQIIVFTNQNQINEMERMELELELNHTFTLYKPVKPTELLEILSSTQTKNDAGESLVSGQEMLGFDLLQNKRTIKILITEDIEVNRILIASFLSKMIRDVEIIEAHNGKEAVEIAKNKRVDIILMDVQMPEMDGLEATRQIRKWEQDLDLHTPIIALTAGVLEEEWKRATQAGMDEFITKPVDLHILCDVIKKYLLVLGLVTLSKDEESVSTIYQSVNTKLPNSSFDKEALLKRMLFDADLVTISLQSGKSQIEEYLKVLDEAAQQQDFEQIKKTAHSLKGLAYTLCFNNLGDLAKELEFNIGQPGKCSMYIQEMHFEWEEILSQID